MKLAAAVVLGIAAMLAMGSPAAATSIVYDNTTFPQGFFFSTALEYGDEVNLAGTERAVTDLSFILYSDAPQTIDVAAAIYANDGPSGEPGTSLWSDHAIVTIDGLTGVGFGVPGVVVPDTLTWTVFTGGTVSGLVLYDPPTVGTSYDWFWRNDAGTWNAYWFGGNPVANFAATIEADPVAVVPEPLTAIGLLICLGGAARYLRGRK